LPSSKTFSSLISRWQMQRSCRYLIASMIGANILLASFSIVRESTITICVTWLAFDVRVEGDTWNVLHDNVDVVVRLNHVIYFENILVINFL
jgi:hypothetical protein